MNDNRIDSVTDGPPQEEWRPVVGYEGYYEISNLGRVKSVRRRRGSWKTPHLMKAHLGNTGYEFVILRRDGVSKDVMVHRMVAKAFIPNPDSKEQVNHIDGNKTNNVVSNLEWATRRENTIHGLYVLGNIDKKRRLTKDQVASIRADTRPQRLIASDYGMTQTMVSGIKTGKLYRDYPGTISSAPAVSSRRLTPDEVRGIRLADGDVKEIAATYGVSAATVRRVRRGERYADVEWV